MDLVQVRTFVAVAEEQHLTRAADRLHISQSAASAHVRAIEESFGVKLFARTKRGLELTNSGSILLREAKDLLNHAMVLASRARELAGHVSGSLNVGCNSDPILSRIAGIVSAMRSGSPAVHLSLHARNSSATRQGLQNGELDVGVLIGRTSDDGLEYLVLRSVAYRIAGPAAWQEDIDSAGWNALARMPWITPIGNSLAYARMIQELFADRGLQRNTVVETDNDVLIRSMVVAGVGLSLVREDHAQEAQKLGQMAVSPIAAAHSDLLVAYPARRSGDPLIKAFASATRQEWPDARYIKHASNESKSQSQNQ